MPATIDKAHNYMQVEIDNDKQSDIKEPWAFLVPLSPLRDVLGHFMLVISMFKRLQNGYKAGGCSLRLLKAAGAHRKLKRPIEDYRG